MRRLLFILPALLVSCGGSTSGDGPAPGDGGDGVDAPRADTAPALERVKNLTIPQIAIFQGVKVPLMQDGAMLVGQRAPVIAGRQGIFRVYVKPGAAWVPREVTGYLTLNNASGTPVVLTDTKTITGESSDNKLTSTLNFEFDTGVIDTSTTYSVVLETAPGQADGPSDGASYPPGTDTDPISALVVGEAFKLVIVPFQYNADHSGRTPDTSDDAAGKWRDALHTLYPTKHVEVTMHAPIAWNQAIAASGSGWGQVLQYTLGLRQKEMAPDNAFYYGVFEPGGSFDSFCAGGCVGGLASVPGSTSDTYVRGAIGLGWQSDFAYATMAQELGHSLGRLHAPCGGAAQVDSKYPYAGGNIGSWGYDIFQKRMQSPTVADFMGYCEPSFVSDYPFAAIASRRAQIATTVPSMRRVPTNHHVVNFGVDGSATWGEDVVLDAPPSGAEESVVYAGRDGRGLRTVTGHYYRYEDIPGGALLIPDGPADFASVRISGVAARPVELLR
ncbi:MAG: hypothetical protein NVS3B10_10160 [Polyangiales bacterium]